MHTTISKNRLHLFIGHTAAIALLAAGTLGVQAQQSAGTTQSLPPISFKTSLAAPIDISRIDISKTDLSNADLSTPDDLKYSSSTGSAELANVENFNIGAGEDQPPPRRRYGRPNYNDSHTNSDGSAKYSFFVGGGFTMPTSDMGKSLSTSYNIQAGGGRNFNKKVGVMLQFDWDNFGIQTNTLNALLGIYDGPPLFFEDQNGNPLSQISGSSHIWSFTVDPIFNFYNSDSKGAYVVAGAGFYHKTATFSTPAIGQECDFFGNCFQFQVNQAFDSYTSNALGVNGGIGLTYKLSHFSGTKFYAEARFIHTFNSARSFSFGDQNLNGLNVFPQNSVDSNYIPITFGVRF
ncbi:MAG TPA: hypothetical protein VHW70_12970 [Edaphobacter sp.]|nr:hypothetical protein [Edaphobacter sp.]